MVSNHLPVTARGWTGRALFGLLIAIGWASGLGAQSVEAELQKAEVGLNCWLIHTTDGQTLEPVNLTALLSQPVAGLRLRVDYTPLPDTASTCMAGKQVRLNSLVVQAAQANPTAGYVKTLPDGRIVAAGKLAPIGITTFQYGSHRLQGYAVRSKRLTLKRWEGQYVIVTGRMVAGYPLEAGPPLLEVSKIEVDKTVRAQ